jgi:hypothetical protein
VTAQRDTASDILRKGRETLAIATLGLSDLKGADPHRRIPGLHNAVVFGRSVTFVLQTLRSVDREGFDRWYLPYQKQMQDDPLLRYFNELRNIIL